MKMQLGLYQNESASETKNFDFTWCLQNKSSFCVKITWDTSLRRLDNLLWILWENQNLCRLLMLPFPSRQDDSGSCTQDTPKMPEFLETKNCKDNQPWAFFSEGCHNFPSQTPPSNYLLGFTFGFKKIVESPHWLITTPHISIDQQPFSKTFFKNHFRLDSLKKQLHINYQLSTINHQQVSSWNFPPGRFIFCRRLVLRHNSIDFFPAQQQQSVHGIQVDSASNSLGVF